jgi:hypothetical protein
MTSRILAITALLAGCVGSETTSRAVAPVATAEPTAAAVARGSSGVPASSASVGAHPHAQLVVTRAQGVPAKQLQTIFTRALGPLERCLPGAGGLLELRVTTRNGALDVSAAPGASIDPTARECAAAALEKVYLQETASHAGGPAVPPSGFTSLVTVRW